MKRGTGAKHKTRPRNRGSSTRSRFRPPNTAAEFFGMPKPTQQVYTSVLSVISRMREGVSRTRAMREAGVTRTQVNRFGASALQKLKNGRYVAKTYDRLLRIVMVVSNEGVVEVATRDSRQASKAGKHSAAVHRYLQTGDTSALAQFEGQHVIDRKGERVALLTDSDELDRLGSAGVLSFESLYAGGF
jgi:hypothetical protein